MPWTLCCIIIDALFSEYWFGCEVAPDHNKDSYYDQHVLHIERGQAYFPVQISGKVRFQRHVRTRGLTCIRYVEYENFNNWEPVVLSMIWGMLF